MINEKTFWEWFKDNNEFYLSINQLDNIEQKDMLLDKFQEKLFEYNENLYFLIGGGENEIQDLIISADGKRDFFSLAKKLVSKAPKFIKWRIIALKPKMEDSFIHEYEGIELNVRKIWFLPLENKKEERLLGLSIYVDNYDSSSENIFYDAIYNILITVLGEENFGLSIGYFDVDQLPLRPEEFGLIELLDLPKYLSWWLEKK